MSWSSILSLVVGVVGLVRDFFSWKRSADDRQAGAAQAKADGLEQESDALKKTQAAINAAHNDPEYKNTEFRD